MRTANRREVLTTGQVARICHVAPRTVSKWFDSGKLRGYRIPGSRERRIPVGQLAAFMRAHGIPLDGLDGGACRVLIVDREFPEAIRQALVESDRYEVRTADNGFDAGVIAQQFRPHVIVLNTATGEDEAAAMCRHVRSHAELQSVKVIAAAPEPDPETARRLLRKGFDGSVARPYSIQALVEAVEEATNLVG